MFFNIAEVLQDIDKHGALFFDIRLIGIPDKVHVNFPVAVRHFLGGLVVWVERLFFIEVVEVLVTNLRGD